MSGTIAEKDAGLTGLTDEGKAHVLPYLKELRASMDRDLTPDDLLMWLNGWISAEKYAANCAISGDEFRWLHTMATRPIPPTGGDA
jgi:hypothetical protein